MPRWGQGQPSTPPLFLLPLVPHAPSPSKYPTAPTTRPASSKLAAQPCSQRAEGAPLDSLAIRGPGRSAAGSASCGCAWARHCVCHTMTHRRASIM